MASIFSRIVTGEIPCYKIAETEEFLAFLDINPVAIGHTLVIPKKEVNNIFDIPEDEYAALWLFSRQVAHAVALAIPCLRVGVAVIGLEVPHAHIHLVPLQTVQDINFAKPKLNPGKSELEAVAAAIIAQLNKVG
jgi:histidine triad (HIT) family protein